MSTVLEISNEYYLQQEKIRDWKCFQYRLNLACYILSPSIKKCIIQLNQICIIGEILSWSLVQIV